MKLTSIVAAAVVGLLSATRNGAVANRHVIPMPSASLFSEANYFIIVDAAEMSDTQGNCLHINNGVNDDRIFGNVLVGHGFLRQMQLQSGISLESSSLDTSDDALLHKRRMTRLVKSSRRHTDVIVGASRKSSNQQRGSLPVGFFVLNSNPDAYFETDDHELCIPMVEGTFVTFNGLRPHRTVINAGHVDLIGPFDMESGNGVVSSDLVHHSYSRCNCNLDWIHSFVSEGHLILILTVSAFLTFFHIAGCIAGGESKLLCFVV